MAELDFDLGEGAVVDVIPLCEGCRHYQGEGTCAAFRPNLIPVEILLNQFDHTNPYPGDNGIQFEPIEEGESQ